MIARPTFKLSAFAETYQYDALRRVWEIEQDRTQALDLGNAENQRILMADVASLDAKDQKKRAALEALRSFNAAQERRFLESRLSSVAAFLGLQNRNLLGEQSARNLFYNFIGWEPNAKVGKQIFNGVASVVVAPVNLVVAVLSTVRNIVKSVVELAPLALANAGDNLYVQGKLDWMNPVVDRSFKVKAALKRVGGALGFGLGRGLLHLLRPLTSPIISGKINHDMAADFADQKGWASNSAKTRALKAGAVALSALTSIAGYGLALPFAAGPAAAAIAPYVPVVVKGVFAQVMSVLAPVTNAFGTALSAIFGTSAAIAAPEAITLGVAALAVTGVYQATNRAVDAVKDDGRYQRTFLRSSGSAPSSSPTMTPVASPRAEHIDRRPAPAAPRATVGADASAAAAAPAPGVTPGAPTLTLVERARAAGNSVQQAFLGLTGGDKKKAAAAAAAAAGPVPGTPEFEAQARAAIAAARGGNGAGTSVGKTAYADGALTPPSPTAPGTVGGNGLDARTDYGFRAVTP